MDDATRTAIYKRTGDSDERLVGYVGANRCIYRPAGRGAAHPCIGRVDDAGRVFHATAHDEREVGYVTADGRIHSHGLFQGGDLGWLDPDGVVVQAGLILGEEEVGRVAGPLPQAAAAALLLILLPADAEENRRL